MSEQIAFVTPELGRTLAQLSTLFRVIDGNKKFNDHDSYDEVATHLEGLTVMTMTAMSSVPLVNTDRTGARFNIASDTELAKQITSNVAYLRGTATELLNGTLNRYESKNVTDALNRLKSTYGMLMYAIVQQMRRDLDTISESGPNKMIGMADTLATAASRPKATNSIPKQGKRDPAG